MKSPLWRGSWIAAALLVVCGCATVRTRVSPKANLAGVKHPYVVHLLTDGRGVDRMIANELRLRGYDAQYGPRTEMPRDADVAIVYQDTWTYDFTTYMIALEIHVRTPRTDYALAIGEARRPSVMGESPTFLIDDIVNKLFPKHPPLPILPPPTGVPNYPVVGGSP